MDDVTKQAGIAGGSIAGQAKPTGGRADNVPSGILMMIAATMLFAGASAASKWLVAEYPVGEVLFLRSLASLIGGAAVILPVTGLSVYATRRPRDHLARGLSQSRNLRSFWPSA
jgi:drug/metabolite transporter (DMT)-like permease